MSVHADRPEALDDEMDESDVLPSLKLAALPADPWLSRELESAIKGIILNLTTRRKWVRPTRCPANGRCSEKDATRAERGFTKSY
jgi:hypothetical protein